MLAAAAASAGITLALDSDGSKKASSRPSYLYAQDAHNGTLVRHGGPGEYDLTLYGVHPTALQFLDRPGNSVAAISVHQLLRRFFTAHGTIGAPPNAAINALVPEQGNHQYLMGVALLTARYDGSRRTLRFHVRQLKQGAPGVREHGRTDVVLPARFGHTSMFIDDSSIPASEVLNATETYAVTGSEQELALPSGINQVTITCNGGQGGAEWEPPGGGGEIAGGGAGASVTATFVVQDSATLYIYVGGQGGRSTSDDINGAGGGFNGGGGGGNSGAGGGGASEVRAGTDDAAHQLLVCAGGGGAASAGGTGGSGGGPAGGDGEQVLFYGQPGVPGKGATQSAGGAGGPDASGSGGDGHDGSFGQGGAGGAGGGGGGYYGGGGGAVDNFGTGGPGGGGSSYVSSGGMSVSMTAGGSAGDGSVTISEYSSIFASLQPGGGL